MGLTILQHVPRIERIAESVRGFLSEEGATSAEADQAKRDLIDFGRSLFVMEWIKPIAGDHEKPSEEDAVTEFNSHLRKENDSHAGKRKGHSEFIGYPSVLGGGGIRSPENAVVCLAAYLAGVYFTSSFHGRSSSIGGLWCVISGIVVLQATFRDAWQSVVLRVLGTLIGATIGGTFFLSVP